MNFEFGVVVGCALSYLVMRLSFWYHNRKNPDVR